MSAFPGRPAHKPTGCRGRRRGTDPAMEREKAPYEGEESEAPGEDFSHIDPDELTGPGGKLPAAPGATEADDPKDDS